jgi:DNA-binding winged helix-turn-helix (wHTH) protein
MGLDRENLAARNQFARPGTMTALSFRDFEIDIQLRKLTYAGGPVAIRSRAFDILTVLAQRAGQLVSKDDIISFVWPHVHVDEGALRVHINALRKALRVHCEDELISNVAGRGYSLAADITRSEPTHSESGPMTSLPWLSFELVGRDEVVRRWSAENQYRACTIVGAPGIGKSSVAIAVARARAAYFDATYYVNLSGGEADVASAIGLAAGLPAALHERSALCLELSRKKVLIVLDGCDEAPSNTAETIDHLLAWTPYLSIIATAREPIGFRGERIKVLAGLVVPPASEHTDPSSFPSVEFFVSVAADVGNSGLHTSSELRLVADIVRSLDGSPAAIEIAARMLRDVPLEVVHERIMRPAAEAKADRGKTGFTAKVRIPSCADQAVSLDSEKLPLERRIGTLTTIHPGIGGSSMSERQERSAANLKRRGTSIQSLCAGVASSTIELRKTRVPPPLPLDPSLKSYASSI